MYISTIFIDNRTQAVRIPTDVRFPDNVKQVTVRASGKELIIAPRESNWDSFFIDPLMVTDDFMPEHATQIQRKCDAL